MGYPPDTFMDINDILNSVFHSEQNFYPALAQMADNLVAGANLLTDMISQEDEKFKQEETYNHIKDIETECDKFTTELFDQINAAWVTPLPKADLHTLCDVMDDVMDNINASAKRMMLYRPEELPNEMMHMTEIVIECTKCVREALSELPNLRRKPQKALSLCNRLHELEHEGDDVYGDFVHDLFESDTEAKEVIKLKEIMGSLESATDCTNKVGKILKTIIVKYN